MATDRNNLDPRFDPTFQRGYTESEHGRSDAVTAARSVDALRHDAAKTAGVPSVPSVPSAGVGMPPTSLAVSSEPPTAAVSARDERAPVAPQSQYVDPSGALAEITPRGGGKSLARNPWIYVLWILGVVLTVGGVAAQMWSYLQLYTETQLAVGDYRVITSLQGLAPIATSVGALSLVGALIVHCFNWMRRNP